MTTLEHPGTLLPVFRRQILWLLATGTLQLLWAAAVFVVSILPPIWLRSMSTPTFLPGIIYALYSGTVALYLLVCTGLAHLLASRGWLRMAFFASVLPGPGILFGVVQVFPAFVALRRLGETRWENFFHWMEKRNRLTARPPSP